MLTDQDSPASPPFARQDEAAAMNPTVAEDTRLEVRCVQRWALGRTNQLDEASERADGRIGSANPA